MWILKFDGVEDSKRPVIATVVLLLLILANLANAEDNNEAFMSAAVRGDLKEVEALASEGADVNAKDHNDRTVLMQAAWFGRLEVVKLLLEKGADINFTNKNGETALLAASGEADWKW